MKKKTINAVITKKFGEWLESIGDEEVKKTEGFNCNMYKREEVV